MKTHAIRILAGLLAAALPTFALAQDSAGATTLGDFSAVADTVDSENLLLHTVQRKPFSDGGRHEVVLYPAVMQLNGKFTSHFGVGAQYLYHLHENFALQAQGTYFYVNEGTPFTDQLIEIGGRQPQTASALTLQWVATGGFEVTPIYGKFAFYEGTMANFGVVLNAGAGVGGTRVQITGEETPIGAFFGDTGLKLVGQIGGGFRVRLNENFLIRLEVKDLIYTARVDKINGCTLADMEVIETNPSAVSSSCDVGRFDNTTKVNRTRELLKDNSSDVLNNISVYGGVSYTF